MMPPNTVKRFAPPRAGKDVPWVEIRTGDWAYWAGHWWKVVSSFTWPDDDQIQVKLERPAHMPVNVFAVGVQRWKKA